MKILDVDFFYKEEQADGSSCVLVAGQQVFEHLKLGWLVDKELLYIISSEYGISH